MKVEGFKSTLKTREGVSFLYLDRELLPLALLTLKLGCVTKTSWVCGLPYFWWCVLRFRPVQTSIATQQEKQEWDSSLGEVIAQPRAGFSLG